jgi:hypothetical protein
MVFGVAVNVFMNSLDQKAAGEGREFYWLTPPDSTPTTRFHGRPDG